MVTDELKEAWQMSKNCAEMNDFAASAWKLREQNAARLAKQVTLKKVLEALDAKHLELLDIVLHLEKAPQFWQYSGCAA